MAFRICANGAALASRRMAVLACLDRVRLMLVGWPVCKALLIDCSALANAADTRNTRQAENKAKTKA